MDEPNNGTLNFDSSGQLPEGGKKTAYGLIKPRSIEDEMQQSYIDYAMTVIVSRALPDVRDGLKPVHRRVLYAMWDTGLKSNSKYRKCAAVVGEVLKAYHPHGDIAVYDTLVRMAQNFSMRYPLVDGQGNFGSMDGDSPAAMRYTEARMAGISEELLTDIERDTVDFADNYDGTTKEPKVLPARLPDLLLNGSMGIAVGMMTNIPPHNLTEITDAIIHLIDQPEAGLDDLMQYIQGPDFPTGANIYNHEDIKTAYSTGKGRIMIRATANIEEQKNGFRIIVSELPYQVNKADLISKIADLVKDKKIEGVSDLRDESDRKEGVRIVIELKSNAYPKKILNRLFELTAMQTAFHVNMLALVDGIQPRVLTIKNILEEYIKHRQVVVERRTKFDLNKAKDRAHILEGLLIALDHIDEVITTIRSSQTREIAHQNLCKKFKLTDPQSSAILEMRLSALAGLERQRVKDEYLEKIKAIASLEAILADQDEILKIIKDEVIEIKAKYGDKRRTQVFKNPIGEFSATDLIPNEQEIVTITKGNYIKRVPANTYKSQIRGGKGVMGMTTKEEDIVEYMLSASTHDDIFFFTDKGRIFQTKVYDLPTSSRQAKGQALVNVIQISQEEKVTAVITLNEESKHKADYFLMATTKGVVKKTEINAYKNVRKTGIIAIKLNGNDELKWVCTTKGDDNVFQITTKGQAIMYSEQDIRPMGRSAAGVRGIKLRTDDSVVSTDIVTKEQLETVDRHHPAPDILIVLENGLGKRTSTEHFRAQIRGGIGMKAANVTDRTGKVVGAQITLGDKGDVIIVSQQGQLIRLSLKSIKRLGRDTQGVTLMRFNNHDFIASVTVVYDEDKDQEKPQEDELPIK
ncbi:MAG: DNA gyrase subunit A [bacterium]|nr:DNA gyrase subunit A [bacterium]